jgi:hypothetical protein
VSRSISLSRFRSATTLHNLTFSSPSYLSRRRISVGSSPLYFFFQVVAWLVAALRWISARYSSLTLLQNDAFCVSENFEAFIVLRPQPRESPRTTLGSVLWAQISPMKRREARSPSIAQRPVPLRIGSAAGGELPGRYAVEPCCSRNCRAGQSVAISKKPGERFLSRAKSARSASETQAAFPKTSCSSRFSELVFTPAMSAVFLSIPGRNAQGAPRWIRCWSLAIPGLPAHLAPS